MDKADTLLMPYFITDKGKDCAGWATVKANGEVIGCHATKAGAIKQMVAVSLAEKIPPGGERALNEELEVGDWVFWDNAGHTEFGLITFISTFGQVVDQLGNELIATQDKPLAKISIYVLDGTTLVGTDQWTVKSFAPLSKLDIDLNQMNDMPEDHPEDHPQDGYDDGNRALPQAVIVDIDDTLIHYDKPMQRVIDYVNALPGRKYIVTGRMQSDHDRTVSQLREAGVEYSALFMKQVDEPTTIFKRRIATKLKGRFHISLAIDNDEDNRAVFRDLGIPTLNPASIGKGELPSERAINQKAPEYMRAAARRGLQYVSEGKGGDGLKQQTINEARRMAAGEVSDDKWIRMAAWIARHLGDLDSPQANPQHPNYPSAGVVAHLLWGSGPSKTKANAAMNYAQGVVERIRKEEERHLLGKHDQSTHGKGGGSMGRMPLDEETVNNMKGGSAAPHIVKNADGTYGFTPERQALHDQIVSDALAGIPRSENPTMVFLGGGAASGKSTAIANSGINISEKHAVINPDDVKTKLPEYKEKSPQDAARFTHEESSYLGKRIQAAAIERKVDIVNDGVGDTSAASMNKKIDAAKKAGYKVSGAYVTVPTDVAWQRSQARAEKSGRHVPEDVLRSAHAGVSRTFPEIMNNFDSVDLFDNTTTLKLIGSGKNGTFKVKDEGLWADFLAKGAE